jgi:DNA-binding Lrp family transcriptional regulator
LKAAAEKRRLDLDPAPGAELETLAKEVMASSPEVIERVQKLLSGK